MSTTFSQSTAIALTSILFLLSVASCTSEEAGAGNEEERATPIAGYELSYMDLSRNITVSSRVEPLTVNRIAARMSGLITGLHAREGDIVSAGDLLAQFDVEEEVAELRRAEAQLEYARARYERIKELRQRDAESESTLEEARTGKQVAESEVDLWSTRVRLGEIRAGKDGVITGKYIESGDAVSANDPLFQLADVSTLVARVGVAERDVVQLETGDPVSIRIDAHSGNSFDGNIRRIFPAAEEDSRLVTVEVEIETDHDEWVIRPGYLARVELTTDHRPEVLAVPSESLLASGRDESFVYIIDENNELKRRNVETGISRRNWIEILEGLQQGDVVVGANPTNLQEDLYVRVTRWVGDDQYGEPVVQEDDV